MSSCIGFSTCRIQFIPNNRPNGERNYSDRSLVELREHDVADISLRALDIENNRKEIFDIHLRKEDQYRKGKSKDSPDELYANDGTYRLWLNEASRAGFHEHLVRCFQQLSIIAPADSDVQKPVQDNSFRYDDQVTDIQDDDVPRNLIQSNPPAVSPKGLLTDVHHLGTYIEQGNVKEATRLASELATKGVRLQVKSAKKEKNEKEFTIQVQLDGNEYGVGQQGIRIPVNVYKSTTVRELRAAFELTYYYPPTNQYFFVNGRLAHDNYTMEDLNVEQNSLFVLFVLTHLKSSKKN